MMVSRKKLKAAGKGLAALKISSKVSMQVQASFEYIDPKEDIGKPFARDKAVL
jgi:hypothetical protein